MIDIHEKEFNEIFNLCKRENICTDGLYIHGPHNCGKTHLVSKAMKLCEDDNVKIIFIDCAEVCALDKDGKCIYEMILMQLVDLNVKRLNELCCKDADEFFCKINQLCKGELSSLSHIYFIFDNAENFGSSNSIVLSNLIKIQENITTELTIFILVISTLPPSKLFQNGCCKGLMELYIRKLDKKEIEKIVLDDFQGAEYQREHYSLFVNLVIQSISMLCKDLSEIRRICRMMWKEAVELTKMEKEYSVPELCNLYNRFVKQSHSFLYQTTPNTTSQLLALPLETRFLLVAAYLASYVPETMDKKLFVSKSSRMNKREKHSNRNVMKDSLLLTGPKQFTVDRWFAIYHFLIQMDEETTKSGQWELKTRAWAALIGQLEQIGFINQSNLSVSKNGGQIKLPRRIRCVASHDIVVGIANSIDVNLSNFL